MEKLTFIGMIVMLCMSCQTKTVSLTGTWVQPIPGQESVQGIRIEKNGAASSVNMHTLVYKHWEQQGNRLILSGESIGNRVSGAFTDTLKIERLTADTLALARGNWKTVYIREK